MYRQPSTRLQKNTPKLAGVLFFLYKKNTVIKTETVNKMKLNKKTLSNILHQHVMPTGTDQKIKLISYFRPQKLGSCFSTRPPKIDPDRVSVVYQFSCTEVVCQATYICHTACTLRKRSSQHKYSISVMHKHYINDHLLSCVPVNFSDNYIMLQNFPDICELLIAEAILIKEKNHPL